MRFLPREEKFFALFLEQVRYISQAAVLLLKGAEAGNARHGVTAGEAAERGVFGVDVQPFADALKQKPA